MRNFPSTPTDQHNLLIDAFCEGLPTGDYSKARRIVEIGRQINSTRDGSVPNKPLPVSNGD